MTKELTEKYLETAIRRKSYLLDRISKVRDIILEELENDLEDVENEIQDLQSVLKTKLQ